MFFKNKSTIADVQSTTNLTSHISRVEQREIERSFTRVFASDEGKKVLAWLQVMTFHRVSGAQTTNDQLRYMEGQRALVAQILRMIDRGKTN